MAVPFRTEIGLEHTIGADGGDGAAGGAGGGCGTLEQQPRWSPLFVGQQLPLSAAQSGCAEHASISLGSQGDG